MSIASEITRINDAKEALKTSINNKLGSQTLISDEKIDEYSSFVDNIQIGTQQPYFGIPESVSESELSNLLVTDRILELPVLDTSKMTDISSFAKNLQYLKKIPLLDFSKVIYGGNDAFIGCYALTDIGGFQGLGSAYTSTQCDNLNLSSCAYITVESACNILNNLGNARAAIKNTPSIIFCEDLQSVFESSTQFNESVSAANALGWTITYNPIV